MIRLLSIFFTGLIILSYHSMIFAQAKIMMNGASITMSQGAYLVIDNPATDAITRTSGIISSEGESNIVKWNIGTTAGTYIVPFGHSSTYIPVTFTKTAGSGSSGAFLFSTYQTGSLNSTLLPTGITNFNGASGADKSYYATDRFWQVNASGYTTKPTLSNLIFTYDDAEFASPNITSVESGLTAQRWNTSSSSWLDYAPTATVNTTNNTVTIASVANTNLYPWWTVNYVQDRHWVAPSSSTWSTTANWSLTAGGTTGAAVPTSIDDVIFDDVNDNSITLGSNATMKSLTLDPGYSGTITQGTNTLTINNGANLSGGTFAGGTTDITVNGPFTLSGTAFTSTAATLDLKGDFSFNAGTFSHNNGTVKFSGTSGTQNINGSQSADFKNINVTNTSASTGVSVEQNENLLGTLTMGNNAVFDADGTSNTAVFQLISSADNTTQDASIATLPSGAQVTGNVTVQRYMSIEGANNTRIYRYISSPIQNASVSDIQNEILVTGLFTGASSCATCGTLPSMFNYDETVITDINNSNANDFNDGYMNFPVVDNTETLTPGKGYSIFVRGDLMTTALWDVRGIINSGNISIPITYTSSGKIANDGWNLVGNPYPSTIDWNAASGWTKTNLTSTIYMNDNGGSTSQFATWNGTTGTNGGSRYIAMGQAYWVKANGSGAPALSLNENTKVAGTQTIFFREAAPENLVRVTMIKGTTRDETVIHFRNDATEDFDDYADALKLANKTFNLSSKGADKSLAINSLPIFECSREVKLDVENATKGDYRFDFTEFESFAENIEITLTDNYTTYVFDVRNGGSYNFSVTTNQSSYGANRFKLNFKAVAPKNDFVVSAQAVCEGSNAIVQVSDSQDRISYTLVSDHSSVLASNIGDGSTLSFLISADSLTTGLRTYSIVAGSCGQEVIKTVDLEVVSKPAVANVTSGKSCSEGEVTLKASGANSDQHYNWYDSEKATTPINDQHESTFVTPSLTKSVTYYVTTVNTLGCESERKPVVAEVLILEAPTINVTGDSVYSNYAEGNQWYFNHEIIQGATDQHLMPSQAGMYTTIVTIDGCSVSADYQFAPIENPSIVAFPNPVSNKVSIEIPSSIQGIREVRLLDGFGHVVGLFELERNGDKHLGKMMMTEFAAGVYVLQVVTDISNFETKIIKK
jgi:hypothetical protein